MCTSTDGKDGRGEANLDIVIQSKNFNSAHQLIGLAVLAMILIQASLGTLHHRIYQKRHQSTVFATVHKILGPIAVVLGLINGIL